MKRFATASLILVCLLSASSALAEIYKQIRISYPDQPTFESILKAGIEPAFVQPGVYIDYAVDERELQAFIELGVPYTVIHEDLTQFYQSRNPLGTTMGGFRTYSEMTAVMDSLAANYPNLCTSKTNIATTENGRALWVFKISDNPSVDEDETEVLVTGLHHAREPIGGEIPLEFARWLLVNYGTDQIATNLVDNFQLYFLPVVNPDGYEYNRETAPNGGGMWRKNRRNNWDGNYGVDLNRNYNYFWGYDDEGSSPSTYSEVYRGPTPASEPEISGLQNFINQHDFAIIVNYHAYGMYFLTPWGYYNGYCEDRYYYTDTLGAYSESIGYSPGTAWELLYPTNGGTEDWGYGQDRTKKRSLALTIEVGNDGDGFWPAQGRIAPLITENKNILKDLLPRAYDALKRRAPQAPTVVSPSSVPPGSQFYLHWQPSMADTFNSAVSFRVIEQSGHSRSTQSFETSNGYTLEGFTRNSARSHGGTYSAYSGQGSNLRRYVTLVEKLMVQQGDNLTFWAWYNIQTDYDYAYVQISTDNGVSWREINGSLSTSYNPHRHNKGFGITGNSNGWVQGTYWLSSYVGREIKIRFAYWTDASGQNEGIYVDDVYPTDAFQSTTVLSETVYPDSFLVGPYTIGTKWFQVEARDDRGQLSGVSNRFQVEILGNTYALSGHVALSDSPPDLSGSIIAVSGAGLADTTNTAGDYQFPMVGQGTYDIIASHPGYYPDTAYAFNISQDTTLDFSLNLAPPGQPILTSPINNATIDTEFVAFNWNDVNFADGYVIEVASDENFANLVVFDSSLALSEYHNGEPFANGIYYWRVTAFNQVGYSVRSSAWHFTINVTLAAPNLLAPSHGYISDSAYVNFDWSDVSRATNYIIEIARDNLFADIAEFDSNLTASAYRNIVPFPNDIYYWRVTARNPDMYSPRSATRSFTVNVVLQAPQLSAPPDGFLTDTSFVNFDWNDVPGAVSYVMEAASDSLFGSMIIVDSAVTGSAYAGNFADGTYFWRVTAFNGMIYSSRSAVRDFSVVTSLAAPQLVAPADDFVSEFDRIDFDWSDVDHALFYIFEVSFDSDFSSHVIDDSTRAGSAYAQAGPFVNGIYYWRVTASNGQVYSPRSETRNFTVSVFPGIPAPQLLSPANGFISSVAFITFDWSDVPDTVVYLFELASDVNFVNMVLQDSAIAPSSYTNTDSLANDGYFWRVKATDGIHWSPYSDIWTLTIDVGGDFLPGDANNSGQVNGLDVVFLVNYLKGGQAPDPMLAADANGTCDVNGLDVVYLVNYFKGGPEPFRGDCLAVVNLERNSAEH